MTATNDTRVATTAREQFEQWIETYAPYIMLDGFQLTSEHEYAEVLQNIQDHKYLTNEGIPFEITMEQALFSWYENVYHPVAMVIEEEGLIWFFPEATRGELFLWVTRHWHFLKQDKGRDISVEEAVHSFGQTFGKGAFNRFLYRLKRLAA
jgi:hypothetical protein